MAEDVPNPKSEQLQKELKETVEDCKDFAKRSYAYAQAVFLLSILTSLAATLLVAAGLTDGSVAAKMFTAFFAAAPATLLTLNNTFKWEEKTRWFWRKERLASGVLSKLMYSRSPQLDQIALQYEEESTKLELEWPAMSAPPAQPTKPAAITSGLATQGSQPNTGAAGAPNGTAAPAQPTKPAPITTGAATGNGQPTNSGAKRGPAGTGGGTGGGGSVPSSSPLDPPAEGAGHAAAPTTRA